MKIIYNSILPTKGYTAINLFSLIFVRKEKSPLPKELKNHEAIHTAQGKELLWVFFYIWYGIEWIVKLIKYRNSKRAYYNISFEREAYANDYNFDYLRNRKIYSFTKYIFLNNICDL